MRATLGHLCPQPAVAVATTLLAAGALSMAGAPALAAPTPGITLPTLLVSLALLGGVVVAALFPIHLRFHSKTAMTSVPLYLMVVLLPPPVAALAVGVGMLIGELALQPQKHNYPSDIATNVARWTLLALVGALVAHARLFTGITPALPLLLAAVLLWAGDLLTAPLILGPMCAERPVTLLRTIVHDCALVEGAQYLLALLGALAAEQNLWALVLLVLPTALVYLAFKSAKEMHDSTRQLLESMADTVDLRDPYTGGHSRRVTDYCQAILTALAVTGPEVALIISAARVHDIGKIAIPDAVLNKPGKLDPEERAMMETHPERGADVLRRYKDFTRGMEIVLHHHEAWDGTGYPHRLVGTAIPFGARVMAVADSYDAMTSDRPYRKGMTPHKAAGILRDGRGRQWDAEIVDAFLCSLSGVLTTPQAVPHLHLVQPERGTASA